jgi:hypothetical protein
MQMRNLGPKRAAIVLAALICVVVLAAVLAILLWPSGGKEEAKTIDPAYISEIHTRLDPKDIPELKQIIESHPDAYTRERAVFALADIAIRNNVTEDVIDFLKGVAYNEENDQVMSAAYSNLYLIRQSHPLETRGDLALRVEGEIKEGNTVTVVASASSTVDVDEAALGVKRIAPAGIGLDGSNADNPVGISLRAGEPQDVPFTIQLGREGKYLILCVLKLSFDRVDYQTIEKGIYLTVGKTGGSFEAAPQETDESLP